MTLELTPQQKTDLNHAIAHHLYFIDRTIGDDPRLAQSQRAASKDHKQRLQSLHDLLTVPHTTIILHHP